MSDLIIKIAELKLEGFCDGFIASMLGIPIEWIDCESVQDTIKTLKGLD